MPVLSKYYPYNEDEIKMLENCIMCPRECGTDRLNNKVGYCKSDSSFRISAVCVHKGEEEIISGSKGICNIFFPHCNLQCVYCQNVQISSNESTTEKIQFDALISEICSVLDKSENVVGFVSPSHYIPQMLAIIRGLKERGKNPVYVYNSNCYDKPETLKMLENIIDVYLPDFKYSHSPLGALYSDAEAYPQIALDALKEMYRQKGSAIFTDDNGIIESGLIVRHLILPGIAEYSIQTLKFIAEEISTGINISLMSQYFPIKTFEYNKNLNRTINKEEYVKVLEALENLGFYKGWTQELDSSRHYIPDFTLKKPFN